MARKNRKETRDEGRGPRSLAARSRGLSLDSRGSLLSELPGFQA